MHEETKGSKVVKWILIGISVLFLFIMLVLPLATVLTEALKSGWQVFWDAVSDEYTLKAVLLTLEATACAVVFNTIFGLFAAWSVTKFHFKGTHRLTGYRIACNCRSDICTYLWQTKCFVSSFTGT